MLCNLINLVVGLFFLIGAFIAFKYQHNKNLVNYSVGMAFIVLLLLLFIDIIPETLELLEGKRWALLSGGAIVGILILFLIEKLIPHHDHYEEVQKHEHHNHLKHIGIVTAIALIIHNLVEGMSIYSVASQNIKTGLIYALGVGLHNIPFGIEITALFEEENDKKKTWLYLSLLSLSTFIGGLFIYLFNDMLSNVTIGLLLSLTIGMVLYLLFNELLVELKENFNKYSVLGILTGLVLILIGALL